jgi:hypothetical protein
MEAFLLKMDSHPGVFAGLLFFHTTLILSLLATALWLLNHL